jgi:hypothetical protein
MNMCPLHHPILLTHICTLFARGGALSCRDNVYCSARGHTAAAATARHAARAWRPRPARDIASRVSRSNWSVPHRPPRGIMCATCAPQIFTDRSTYDRSHVQFRVLIVYMCCVRTRLFAGRRWLFRVTLACVILFRSVVDLFPWVGLLRTVHDEY